MPKRKAVRNDGFFVLCPLYVRRLFQTGKEAGNSRLRFPLSVIGQLSVLIDHFGSFQSQTVHHILLVSSCAEYRRSVAMPLVMHPKSALCFGQGVGAAFRRGPGNGCWNSLAGLVMLPGLEFWATCSALSATRPGSKRCLGSVKQPAPLARPATERLRRNGRAWGKKEVNGVQG